jgi:hypothetical protein
MAAAESSPIIPGGHGFGMDMATRTETLRTSGINPLGRSLILLGLAKLICFRVQHGIKGFFHSWPCHLSEMILELSFASFNKTRQVVTRVCRITAFTSIQNVRKKAYVIAALSPCHQKPGPLSSEKQSLEMAYI